MAKIKINTESFAGANIEEEILKAVNAATPAGIVPRAEVIKDANGKVVQVNVNLPVNISKADLANAQAAVQNNPGVSKSKAFPVGGTVEDFDDQTPDDLLISNSSSGIVDIDGSNLFMQMINPDCELRAALSADSVGATGSGLEFRDRSTVASLTTHLNRHGQTIQAIDNDLSKIGAWRYKATLKLKDQSFNGDVSEKVTLLFIDIGGAASDQYVLEFDPNTHGNNNWHIRSTTGEGPTDTGIDRYSFITAEWKYGLDGVMTLTAGAVSISHDYGFVDLKGQIPMFVRIEDTFAVAAAGQSKSLIMDNMTVEVLSGN